MPEKINSLTDLPLDVLLLITPYLDAKSFLRLTSTCKAFRQQTILFDANYWSNATRSTFRVPNQPVVEHDGARWQHLFRRLLTQTRAYTWGSNAHGCLDHSQPSPEESRHYIGRRARASHPSPMQSTGDLGIIADLQCGGWSTTLLTSNGTLHTVGELDGGRRPRNIRGNLRELTYPIPFSPTSDAYNPYCRIKQFSSGRSHVLGVADSGSIWSWSSASKPGIHIKFMSHELYEGSQYSPTRPHGSVIKVVAGWTKSSVLIKGVGIVLWEIVHREGDDQNESSADTFMIGITALIPKTWYYRPVGSAREPSEDSRLVGQTIGQVRNYILLENFVVLVTDLGRVFAAKIVPESHGSFNTDLMVELTELQGNPDKDNEPCVKDVQGSFRSFAIFKSTGAVLVASQDYLHEQWNSVFDTANATQTSGTDSAIGRLRPHVKLIPALQNSGVIALAFGDYHFHALHRDGSITSYGTEPQACGALGLSGEGDPEGRIRGIRYTGPGRDGTLVRHAYTHGRHIWFEPEKKQWIRFMTSGGVNPEEAQVRMQMSMVDPWVQGEVSEWFEQQGTGWDKEGDIGKGVDDEGMGSYFALSVAAGGWHSGALVLVNEALADRVRERYVWAGDSFPRLSLSNGREMPGQVPFSEWKYGRPEFIIESDDF
ncbi:regulator of chromosome condensation 1/beta-lactamase-inhibitor protein II [Lineolata rhizophorae]|uniref:Regulator of chromosome condensation 1/beta-lactamase-inhibitor protein II n=1 Tax=Lineolata rhizophorae TaxID=578093 RepID=A0A6A6NPC3_9PEZI|nr:regulator of chromosome condensation 1/beta-lactamase-inhibitor protein II [Lineolata rhizophorae]